MGFSLALPLKIWGKPLWALLPHSQLSYSTGCYEDTGKNIRKRCTYVIIHSFIHHSKNNSWAFTMSSRQAPTSANKPVKHGPCLLVHCRRKRMGSRFPGAMKMHVRRETVDEIWPFFKTWYQSQEKPFWCLSSHKPSGVHSPQLSTAKCLLWSWTVSSYLQFPAESLSSSPKQMMFAETGWAEAEAWKTEKSQCVGSTWRKAVRKCSHTAQALSRLWGLLASKEGTCPRLNP